MKTLFVLALLICLGAASKYHKTKKHHCPYYPGYFKYPGDCAMFIQCDAFGVAHYKHCPYPTVFNPKKKVCDHYKKYLCKHGYPYHKYKYSKKNKRCPYYPGYFKHPGDCTKFIQCDAFGVAHYKRCPYPTVFNPKKKVCDHYKKYLCKHGYPYHKYKYSKKSKYCPYYPGHFKYPGDCTMFIQCDAFGVAHYKHCPYPTVFNPKAKVCDHYNKYLCRYGYKKNPCKYGKKYYPHKKNCHKYLQCVHGFPKQRQCPSGLVWDNSLKRCEWYKAKYYKRCYKRRY